MARFGLSGSRNEAIGLAASLFLAAYAVSPTASVAGEAIAPACRSAGGELARLRCSTALSKKATVGFDARTRAAEDRIASSHKISDAALTSKACFDTVTQDILAAKKWGPLSPVQKTVFRTRLAECDKT